MYSDALSTTLHSRNGTLFQSVSVLSRCPPCQVIHFRELDRLWGVVATLSGTATVNEDIRRHRPIKRRGAMK